MKNKLSMLTGLFLQDQFWKSSFENSFFQGASYMKNRLYKPRADYENTKLRYYIFKYQYHIF